MACIAAFLLAVLGPAREEDAFWAFAGALENRVPASCVLEVRPASHRAHARRQTGAARWPEDAFWTAAGLMQVCDLASWVLGAHDSICPTPSTCLTPDSSLLDLHQQANRQALPPPDPVAWAHKNRWSF